jgi:hypothetical protein
MQVRVGIVYFRIRLLLIQLIYEFYDCNMSSDIVCWVLCNDQQERLNLGFKKKKLLLLLLLSSSSSSSLKLDYINILWVTLCSEVC